MDIEGDTKWALSEKLHACSAIVVDARRPNARGLDVQHTPVFEPCKDVVII